MPHLIMPQTYKKVETGSKFTASAAYGSGGSYTHRTPSVAETDRTKGIFSCCVKRGNAGTAGTDSEFFFGTGGDLLFNTNDHSTTLSFEINGKISSAAATGTGGGAISVWNVSTDAQFEDFSSWYHVILSFDTNQVTGTDRVQIYVNGIKQDITFASTPTISQDTSVGKTVPHFLGTYGGNGGGGDNFSFDGYMSEARFIPNKSLADGDYAITDFGSFDANGVWEPAILDSASFTTGTNGFYFPDPSNITDASGANNDFTKAGTVTTHVDVPDLNYCSMNPLDLGLTRYFDKQNRQVGIGTAATTQKVRGTQFVSSGKWQWDFTIDAVYAGSANVNLGIRDAGEDIYTDSNVGAKDHFYNLITYTGVATDVFTTYLDLDAGAIWVAKNGTLQNGATIGEVESGDTTNAIITGIVPGLYAPAFIDQAASTGAGGTFSFAETDLVYALATGFKTISRANGSTPAGQGRDGLNALLYTGTGAATAVSGMNFRPSVVFIKNRDAVSDWVVTDLVRGPRQELKFNTSSAEATANNGLTSFDSDGFTLGSGGDYNTVSNNFVSFGLRGGTSIVSNTDGTITSNVSVSQAQNFSVVTYTGTGSAGATVGHGLAFKPDFVMVKCRSDASTGWIVQNGFSGSTAFTRFNSNAAEVTGNNGMFNSTDPTSTLFTLGSDAETNGSGRTYVAYCIASVPKVVKIGTYDGIGSTDGPYLPLDFKPKWIIVKPLTAIGEWAIWDTSRNNDNRADSKWLNISSSAAESTGGNDEIQFHSDGFKFRTDENAWAGSGIEYLYIAVSEVAGGGIGSILPAYGNGSTGLGTTGAPVTESYVLRNDGSFVLRNDGSKIIRNS